MKEGKGKFTIKIIKTAGKSYNSFYVYIPAGVANDSTFPFTDGQKVKVVIQNGRLIIEPEG